MVFWTTDGQIIGNRGVHSQASELILLSGDHFAREKILRQPIGYKRNLIVENNILKLYQRNSR